MDYGDGLSLVDRLKRLPILLVLLIVLPIQVFGIFCVRDLSPDTPSADFRLYYLPAAESLLEGRGPTVDGKMLTKYPVGYPAWVAGLLLFSRVVNIPLADIIVLTNVLCNAATVLALFAFGFRLAGLRVAVASALLAGLYPLYFYLSKQGASQVPYLPLVAWGVYAIYSGHLRNRLRLFALGGALFGLAGIFRPAILAILAVILVYVTVFTRTGIARRLLRPALIAGAFVVVVLPWEITLFYETGRVLPLASNTYLSTREADQPKVPLGPESTVIDHGRELLRRARLAWYRTRSGRYQSFALLGNLPYLLLVPIGFLVGLRRPQRRWGMGLALSCLLAAWGMSTLSTFLARYTTTGVILSATVAGMGLVRLLERFKLLDRKKQAPA